MADRKPKRPVEKFAFSEARIRDLPTPSEEERVRFWYDSKTAGLRVCKTRKGTTSFYLYRWADGRPVKVFIGKWPDVSVVQARSAANGHIGDISKGGKPDVERRKRRQEPTLADLWQEYLEGHAKPLKKTWKDDERQYNKYLQELHNRKLSAITTSVVTKWHAGIATNHGPIQANRTKALLATMFSKASKAVGYTGPNPCKDVANRPERSRERFLLPQEMQAFFLSLSKEDPYWQAFFLLCLLTGTRRGNVASMAWKEVDLENGVWHIPAEKVKNKRPTSIALCTPAIAILRSRYEERQGNPWVFPADAKEGHLIDPRKAWLRIVDNMRICPSCKESVGADPKVCPKCNAKLPPAENLDLHMHDLRRTQGSWQAAMGISLAIIGKTLGHADLKSTQVYARLQLDPVKEAVSKTATSFFAAGNITLGDDGAIEPVKTITVQPTTPPSTSTTDKDDTAKS